MGPRVTPGCCHRFSFLCSLPALLIWPEKFSLHLVQPIARPSLRRNSSAARRLSDTLQKLLCWLTNNSSEYRPQLCISVGLLAQLAPKSFRRSILTKCRKQFTDC